MNISGPHVNKLDNNVKSKIRQYKPKTIKFLNTAYSPDFVDECLSWGSLIILRDVFDHESDTEFPARMSNALKLFNGSANKQVILEIPLNESDQSGDSLSRYVELSIPILSQIQQAGFRPAFGNFSTGNPPDIADGALRLQPIIPTIISTNGFLSLHEYWRPDSQLDGWNPLRYRKLVQAIGQDIPVLITESGIDKVDGIQNYRGYKTYGKAPDWYASQLSSYIQEVGRDNYVFGITFYCAGQFGDWQDFDYVDEDIIWQAIVKDYGAGSRVYPVIKKENSMKFGLMYRMGSDYPDWVSFDDVTNYLKANGFNVVCPKVADGDEFTGGTEDWQDKSLLAVSSLSHIASDIRYFNTKEIEYIPWVCPRGMDIDSEATLHANIANTTGKLIVDFEFNYKGFFDHSDMSGAESYFKQLRNLAPSATIILCPDPRQVDNFSNLFQYVDVLSDQDYWTDFQQPANLVAGQEITRDSHGKPKWPVLPGNTTKEDLSFVIDQFSASSYVFIFQKSSWNPNNAQVLLNRSGPHTAVDYKNLGQGFVELCQHLNAYPLGPEEDFVINGTKVGRQVLIQSGPTLYVGLYRDFTNTVSFVEFK